MGSRKTHDAGQAHPEQDWAFAEDARPRPRQAAGMRAARGDAEESAGQAGVMGHLLVVLDSEAGFGRSGLL